MIEYDTIQIEKIEISEDLLTCYEEEGYTYLHCTFHCNRVGGIWINIYKTSFLVNGKTKLGLIHALNIPYPPAVKVLSNRGDSHNFTLVFPAIPKDWETFDFSERAGRGKMNFDTIRNIRRNNSGVYKVIITF